MVWICQITWWDNYTHLIDTKAKIAQKKKARHQGITHSCMTRLGTLWRPWDRWQVTGVTSGLNLTENWTNLVGQHTKILLLTCIRQQAESNNISRARPDNRENRWTWWNVFEVTGTTVIKMRQRLNLWQLRFVSNIIRRISSGTIFSKVSKYLIIMSGGRTLYAN